MADIDWKNETVTTDNRVQIYESLLNQNVPQLEASGYVDRALANNTSVNVVQTFDDDTLTKLEEVLRYGGVSENSIPDEIQVSVKSGCTTSAKVLENTLSESRIEEAVAKYDEKHPDDEFIYGYDAEDWDSLEEKPDNSDLLIEDVWALNDTSEEGRATAKISSIYSNNSSFNMQYTADKSFSSSEAEELLTAVNKLYIPLESIENMISSVAGTFDGLNDDTKAKVSDIGPGSYLSSQLKVSIFKWTDYIDTMTSNITTCLKIAGYFEGINGPPGSDPTALPNGENGPGYGGSESPTETPSFTSTGGGGGGSKNKKPKQEDETSKIVSTVFGSLVFTSIVPLYTEIGKPSTIQSSLTSQYDVTGIVYQDGKYYYRIYDNNLKSTYFAEIDKNSTFKTDYKEVLKMKEENMMLNKPEIGDSTLSKLSDPKEVYFSTGTTPGTGEAEGITFVNVLDGSDGKTYYVALSDSVELMPIESLATVATGTTGTAAIESVG